MKNFSILVSLDFVYLTYSDSIPFTLSRCENNVIALLHARVSIIYNTRMTCGPMSYSRIYAKNFMCKKDMLRDLFD